MTVTTPVTFSVIRVSVLVITVGVLCVVGLGIAGEGPLHVLHWVADEVTRLYRRLPGWGQL